MANLNANPASTLPGLRLVDGADIAALFAQVNFSSNIVISSDNGTTQTLTAAMISGGGAVYHTSTGGTTPTLTMPTAAAIIAANPSFSIGQEYTLRFINANSGTATIAAGAGITTSGTLTLATNTTRDFVISYTAAGALTMTSVGTGTTS